MSLDRLFYIKIINKLSSMNTYKFIIYYNNKNVNINNNNNIIYNLYILYIYINIYNLVYFNLFLILIINKYKDLLF